MTDADWYLDNVLAVAGPGAPRPLPMLPIERWTRWWRDRWDELGEDALAGLARRQGFVATSTQLREHDWALHDVRRAVRRGQAWSPLRGTLSPVLVPVPQSGDVASSLLAQRRRHALTASAAAALHPRSVISARSAAVVQGLPTLAVPARPVLTERDAASPGRHGAALLRDAALPARDVGDWFGAAVTTPARTVADLARHDRRDGLIAADAALREDVVTRDDLDAALAGAIGWPGVRQARDVLALADPAAESALETIARLALHDDGFPPPVLQHVIVDPTRGRHYRVDFAWPHLRVVLEADGRLKYTGDALWREKRRQQRLHELGWVVERVVWEDVLRFWPQTSRRLRRVLGR